MRTLTRILLVELWPIKGQAYFVGVIKLITRIQRDHRLGTWVHQLTLVLVLSSILSVVHYFGEDYALVLVTFDYVGLLQLPTNINLAKVLINISVYKFYDYIYWVGP